MTWSEVTIDELLPGDVYMGIHDACWCMLISVKGDRGDMRKQFRLLHNLLGNELRVSTWWCHARVRVLR